MSLSDAQKAAVRLYLGYERGRDLYPELESKLDSFSAEEETQVGVVLSALASLDAKVLEVSTNGVLEAVKVGELELRDGDPLELYAKQGRRYVARLEVLTGVDALKDYFGEGSSGGTLGGGPIPLG